MNGQNNTYEELKKAYLRMQGVQHVTSELAKAMTKSVVAKVIIEEGFKVLGAHSGDIALLNEHKEFELLGIKGYPKTFLQQVPSPKEDPPLLTLMVIKTQKPYFLSDISKVHRSFTIAKKYLQTVNAASSALLPLRINGVVTGVMQFAFKKFQEFTKEDKEFMMTLAQQCSQAFDRVIAQEKLAESKKELEIILSTVADGIIVQNEGGEIVYANKAVSQVFKDIKYHDFFTYKWEDFLNLFDIEDEEGNMLSHALMPGRRAIAARKPIKVTYKFTHKASQESHWLQIESTAIIGENKKPSISVSVFQDITKLKEIEQRKDDFISIASHELKTPLTSAKVFTQVLKKQLAAKKLKDEERLVDKIDRQLEQLNDLTKDLLDITKIQKGKLEMEKSTFRLDKVIKDVVGDLQPSTEHEIRVYQNEQVTLYADKEKLSQVITNFITNAIKYSPITQKIDVRIFKNGKSVKISVTDRGIGIASQDVEKIFERFYRIEKDRKTYPGLGLGLYISSEIIREHGGEIGVKSEKGKGSTFYFSLPLKGKEDSESI